MPHFYPAPILLPLGVELQKWAVIACDQFTSDPDYWLRVRAYVADASSTLHMVLPEAELGSDDDEKIRRINSEMLRVCTGGILKEYEASYIYVERTLENGTVRPGILGMVDLDSYDYHPGSQSPVRATEETVLERIPPRMKVRQDACLEFPHVLLLCDDQQDALIGPVRSHKDRLTKLYDFDLMEGGGHISGWLLTEEEKEAFDSRLAAYADALNEKYPDLQEAKVLFAVGDGNHSLATAKSCYEALKASNPSKDWSCHPARFALVELENIHDPSQIFEPIHRLLTGVCVEKLLDSLGKVCAADGYPVEYVTAEERNMLYLDRSRGELAVAVLQEALDAYLRENPGSLDYIHGSQEVVALAKQEGAVAFLLPAMKKTQLFRGVIRGGVLPRKTFSMGHAREKRYYLEGRKIR